MSPATASVSASTTSNVSRRKTSRLRNLLKNMKIMNKDYHMVNPNNPEEMIVVHPPSTMLPGLNMDGKDPKDEQGRWIRVFSIIRTNGVERFKGKRILILKHLPGDHAAWEDPKGNLWEIRPIEGVHAEKPRGKHRKHHRKQKGTRKAQHQAVSTVRSSLKKSVPAPSASRPGPTKRHKEHAVKNE